MSERQHLQNKFRFIISCIIVAMRRNNLEFMQVEKRSPIRKIGEIGEIGELTALYKKKLTWACRVVKRVCSLNSAGQIGS